MFKNLIILIAIILATFSTQAQTTNRIAYAQIIQSVESSGLLKATNYAFEPYLTYAPNIKAGDKTGGGFLAIYNLNTYVGAGLGADYLGQFSLVSGNATLRLPINAGKYVQEYAPFLTFATNLVVTPFVLGGIGTSLSGGAPSVSTIEDAGAYFQFGNLWGGKFNVGACYGQWNDAGDYSGQRYHAFAGWSKGF